MDAQWVSRLNQRIFALWVGGATRADVAPWGITQLMADKLRGCVATEGYGDGGPIAQALAELTSELTTLPEAPGGCECELCQERAELRAWFGKPVRMAQCQACGDLSVWAALHGGYCAECAGV